MEETEAISNGTKYLAMTRKRCFTFEYHANSWVTSLVSTLTALPTLILDRMKWNKER
jgi:hypothetical protein